MSNQKNTLNNNFQIIVGSEEHAKYSQTICDIIEESARVRGTGIAKRDPNYIAKKLNTGNAIIALDGDRVIGFCYIETYSNANYVSNSGLIVDPEYRKHGLARLIKKATFNLARDLYPAAKVFGITTSGPVMKINSELGYIPVTFSELTQDEEFWKGCSSCPNYDILQLKERKVCLCTGMLAPSKFEEEAMKFDLTNRILNQKEVEKVDLKKRFATDFF
jgi:GNAT superfamily N-acetyltransferase